MAQDAIAAARAHLADALVREGFAREAIRFNDDDGPFGTQAVLAQAEGAYPGTGVRAALVAADGTLYGSCFDNGIVAFTRAQGWFDALPDAGDVVTAIDLLALDGLLQLDEDSAPSITRTAEGLDVRFTRVAFPSGTQEPMLARITSRFELRALPVPSSEPTPIDAATRLLRALDSDTGVAIMQAIPQIPASPSERDRAALARASLHTNENIAMAAMMKLGASAPALAALRDALAAAPERRDEVVGWVRDLFDDNAAKRL